MLCTTETFRNMLALDALLRPSDEEADRRMAEYARERRLKAVKRYLRERAARTPA